MRPLSTLCWTLPLLAPLPLLHAFVDADADGISDVWAAQYPDAGDPAADPDHDGADNLAEARAGTDPLDAASCLHGTITADANGALQLRWPSVAHKTYQVQASTDLRSWSNLGAPLAGTGTEVSALVRGADAAATPHNYWRVHAADRDTDADGISEWEAAVSFARITARLEADALIDYRSDPYTITAWLNAQNPDGSWFDRSVYESRARNDWPPYAHLRRLVFIASAFADPASPHQHSPALLSAYSRGLQCWIELAPASDNVWHNYIGAPQLLGPGLVLMRDQLDPALLAAGAALIPAEPHDGAWSTGANLVWNSILTLHRGTAARDPALVARSIAQIKRALATTTGEGIQIDGSFFQHTTLLYNGGYGLALIKDAARAVRAVHGTAYALGQADRAGLDHLVLDGDAWMIRRTTFDYSTQGRNHARAVGETTTALTQRVLDTIDLILAVGSPRAAELQQLRAHIGGTADGVTGHRHFWRSDYTVHREPAAMVSLRLVSRRTVGAESGSNENLLGLHQGCGQTLLYRDGLEYHQIFPAWDWRRIPGTTTEQGTAAPGFHGFVRSTEPFVGGVSDGAVGLSAFTQTEIKSVTYDGQPPVVFPLPAARKSWFFFGDGFLALGAGISSATANPVATTLNQCLLRGDVRVSAGGTVSTRANGDTSIANTSWVQHDGVGYVFPAPTTVRLSNTPRTGSWSLITAYASADPVTKDVFTLGLDHGTAPTDATYAYVVLPGADEAATAAFAAQNPIVILANTPQLQAARIASLHLNAVAFFAPGSVTLKPGLGIASDQPALLLVRTVTNGHDLTVAEPTQLLAVLNLTVTGRYTAPGATYDSASNTTHLAVTLPAGELAGSSTTIPLRQEPPPPVITMLRCVSR